MKNAFKGVSLRYKMLSSDNRDILSGAFLAFIMKLIGAVVAFYLTILIARKFGIEESGYYFFTISTLLFLSSLSLLGLPNAVLKEVSIHLNNNTYNVNLLIKSLILILLSCFSLILLGYILAFFASNLGYEHYILQRFHLYIFICLFPFCAMFILSSYFQACKKIFSSMLTLNLSYQLLLLLYLLVFDSHSIESLLFALFISLSIVVILALFKTLTPNNIFSAHTAKSSYTAILALSAPMMVMHVVSQLNQFSSQFLLSIYSTPSEVSIFSVCLRVSMLMSFLVFAINRVSAPKFAKLFSEGKLQELNSVVIFSNRLLFAFCLPILILIILFGDNVLGYFGTGFKNGHTVLIILTLGQFVASITGTVIFLLQMTGMQKELRNNVIIATVFSLTIGIILVPLYGLVGAALMTFISLSLTNLFSCYKAKKILNINPLKIF